MICQVELCSVLLTGQMGWEMRHSMFRPHITLRIYSSSFYVKKNTHRIKITTNETVFKTVYGNFDVTAWDFEVPLFPPTTHNKFGDIQMCLFADRSTFPLLFDRLTCRLRMLPEGCASMSKKKQPSARQQVERHGAVKHQDKNKANPPSSLLRNWPKVCCWRSNKLRAGRSRNRVSILFQPVKWSGRQADYVPPSSAGLRGLEIHLHSPILLIHAVLH